MVGGGGGCSERFVESERRILVHIPVPAPPSPLVNDALSISAACCCVASIFATLLGWQSYTHMTGRESRSLAMWSLSARMPHKVCIPVTVSYAAVRRGTTRTFPGPHVPGTNPPDECERMYDQIALAEMRGVCCCLR